MPRTAETIDWYNRRHELECGMVFTSCWGIVKLEGQTPGDGTKWDALSWTGRGWTLDGATIEPGDLTERLPDNYAGETHGVQA